MEKNNRRWPARLGLAVSDPEVPDQRHLSRAVALPAPLPSVSLAGSRRETQGAPPGALGPWLGEHRFGSQPGE